jgi:glycosyltransferase involved in cell wall biosynthesis
MGGAKVNIELAAEFERLGWECRLIAPDEIGPHADVGFSPRATTESADALARYLEVNAAQFDVVDFCHLLLPFERRRFPASTLLVARVTLLPQHFERIRIPVFRRPRSWVGALMRGPARRAAVDFYIRQAHRTFETADVIHVNNDYDRDELLRRGFPADKIFLEALGIPSARLEAFGPTAPPPEAPRLAFIGTFDERKGATDLPGIFARTVKTHPNATLRLLGTRNMPIDKVKRFFPRALRDKVEVVTEFDGDRLPELLRDCSLGIFPSYLESFGFAVLEMLGASLPVIAYDTPGPPMMLPREYLVPRGDAREFADRVNRLLGDRNRLAAARHWARARAHEFTWDRRARATAEGYAARVRALRAGTLRAGDARAAAGARR